jgi:hypothetical protein
MHPLLMNFIKSSIGKKYDFGTLKLMRKTSGDDNEKESKEDQRTKRTRKYN